MRRLLPAAGMAVVLHGLFFLAGDFRPGTTGPLDSRQTRVVTIQLQELRPHSDSPAPEPLPPEPEPEQPASWAERPGVVFNSPTPRPMGMRTRTGHASPVPPRAMSSGPAPASPKAPIGREPGSSLPMVEAVPLYLENPPPLYPQLARRRGYEGVVLLEVLVTEEGGVGEIEVALSSGHTLLDRAAVQAVREWRFEPGQMGDRPLAMRVRIPVRFRLQ